MESRQLVTYPTALQLTGLKRRTLFKRMREHGVLPLVDPNDRRLRWLDARDVARLANPVEKLVERKQRRAA